MTVAELQQLLKQYDPDMEVMIGHVASDYWNTEVAEELDDVEVHPVQPSEYHDAFRVCEDGHESAEGARSVVLLRKW